MSEALDRKLTKRTAVVVLSMHRSGTSAMTRVLSLLGCTLPETLIAGRENANPTGFWESRAVVDLNDAICTSAGLSSNDWRLLSHDWLSSPVREGFVDQAHEVLEKEFGNSRFFVLKDPRLCRLMPVWAEALELFKARPVYVVPLRNPFEVAASLRKRDDLIEGDSHLAWLRHMLDAERHSRNQPRVFLRYDDLLGNWRRTVDRISDKLDLSWPNRSISAEDEIDAFLAPDLRHQSVDDARVLDDARLSPWIKQCYDIMSRWARDETRDHDVETLDRINVEMNAAAPAFVRVVAEARTLGRNRRELAKRLEAADASARKQGEALAAARAERDQSETNFSAAQAELAQLRDRLSQADSALAQRRAELDETNGELEKLRAERDQSETNFSAAQAELTQLRDRLSQTESALAQRRAELDETNIELETLRAELADRDDRLRSLDTQCAAERENARLAVHQVSQEAKNRLAELESDLGAMRQQVKELSKGLSEAEQERLQHRSQAWSLLNDYMRRIDRDLHHPGPRILSRLDPLKRLRLRQTARELRESAFFDAEWYLEQNADVAKAGMDPALHFIQHGFREGRAPSARLDEAQ